MRSTNIRLHDQVHSTLFLSVACGLRCRQYVDIRRQKRGELASRFILNLSGDIDRRLARPKTPFWSSERPTHVRRGWQYDSCSFEDVPCFSWRKSRAFSVLAVALGSNVADGC